MFAHCARNRPHALAHRLTAGHRILVPLIEVRILVGQPEKTAFTKRVRSVFLPMYQVLYVALRNACRSYWLSISKRGTFYFLTSSHAVIQLKR